MDSKSFAKPGGSAGKPAALDYLTNTEDKARFLSASRDLTDDEYEDLVNDVGARAALWELRAQACAGDVKAIDVYLKRCDAWREAKRLRKHDAGGDAASAPLMPERRPKPSPATERASLEPTAGKASSPDHT